MRHGPHKMQVSEYMTKLSSQGLLEDRLRVYSRLLESNEQASVSRQDESYPIYLGYDDLNDTGTKRNKVP
jgi:hypothetical protein